MYLRRIFLKLFTPSCGIALLFLVILPQTASSECASGNFPVRLGANWTFIKIPPKDQLREVTISTEDLSAMLRWNGETASAPKNKPMTCQEYLARFPDSTVSTSIGEWNWHAGSWEGSQFLRKCMILKLIAQARPATKSCIEHFELTPSVANDLPSTLGLIVSSEDQRGMAESKSLPAWSPRMNFTLSDENELIGRVESTSDSEKNMFEEDHFEIVAFGDFNRDGFQDVLLSLRNLSAGTYGELRLALLSRTTSQGLLTHISIDK